MAKVIRQTGTALEPKTQRVSSTARYCYACDKFMGARVCRACGMTTEPAMQDDAADTKSGR
jgi:rRNA maturation endonuclease Nob1